MSPENHCPYCEADLKPVSHGPGIFCGIRVNNEIVSLAYQAGIDRGEIEKAMPILVRLLINNPVLYKRMLCPYGNGRDFESCKIYRKNN